MSTDECGTLPLFEVPPVAVPASTRLSRADRQAAGIAYGLHPLSSSRTVIPLHPLAERVAGAHGRQDEPYRCGLCWWLGRPYGDRGPKCLVNDRARVTPGPASDVQPWWPACPSWTPIPGGGDQR